MTKVTSLLLIMMLLAACGSTVTTVSPTAVPVVEATAVPATTEEAKLDEAPATTIPVATTPAVMPTLSGINIDAFDRSGLVQDPGVVDCTLTDGTESTCAQLVVKHVPDDFETGPFCPKTLADEGGIWNWDGDNPGLYRLNEAFWTMVNEQGFTFYDEAGNINIEDPGPEGPNAVLEGNNCIEIAEDTTAEVTVLIPVHPVMAENPTRLGVVSQVGLALTSIPIFSDAPSVFVTNNLPALDPCGGHIDPGGWYHWHATATDIEFEL